MTAPAQPVPAGSPAAAGRGQRARDRHSERTLGIAAVVLAVVGLSTGSTLVKLTGSPGSVVAFWRLAFGAVIWQGLLLVRGKRLTWTIVRSVAPAGVLFGLDLILFFGAVTHTRVANAEFIGTLVPVISVPLAAVIFHERLRLGPLLLGLPALVGVGLIVFGSPAKGSQSTLGNLMALGATMTWVAYLFVTKSVRRKVGTMEFMSAMTIVAALVVAPVAVSTGEILSATAKAWVIFAVLGLVTGTLAHGLITWSQTRVELGVITILALAQPALAALWAYLFLDENVRPVQVIGMVVVLSSLSAFTWLTARR